MELASCLVLFSCFGYCQALKMEAVCSFETSAELQMATWHYIPANLNSEAGVGIPISSSVDGLEIAEQSLRKQRRQTLADQTDCETTKAFH
jgi:hypothetical protein